jgi:hypothetical protein
MIPFDPDYVRNVNRTCRSAGCIGFHAVVPKIVESIADHRDTILDFGAGKRAIHAQGFHRLCYNITAFEIGENYDPYIHDDRALLRTYSLIYCSNVVNVQPGIEYVEWILESVYRCLLPGGRFVVNYPKDPRKNPTMTEHRFVQLLSKYFSVERCNTASPAWICRKRGDT